MIKPLRRIAVVSLALALALLGSGVMLPAIQAFAAPVLPNMNVILQARGSSYSASIEVGNKFTFQAFVQNTGNVSLEMVANLDVPQNWDLNNSYNNCGSSLAPGNTCAFSWELTPQAGGSVYLRVYTRGLYADDSGNASRITRAPAFLMNVVVPAPVQSLLNSNTSTSTSSTSVSPALTNPAMSVMLTVNDRYTYAATVYAEQSLIFRAVVKNTGNIDLQVVANLNVPDGWDVDQNKFSDCPDSLSPKDTCTVSWYFTPQGSGQVYVRVYVRGIYDTPYGGTYRTTLSPAFIFNVKPAK